ncbi:MAG: hypothetical protein NZM35_09320, partial [Chitinophagales bacterium]|nr:hypothetical protein [Chitinophagales bacterium]
RTVGEVEALRAAGDFVLFAVDADPRLRYERILRRGSETDHISYETFLENEAREMNNTDPHKQNLAACMRMADYHFNNDDGFNGLFEQIDDALQQLRKTHE